MPAATFHELRERLRQFWLAEGCTEHGPCDLPLRLGTLSPSVFYALGSERSRLSLQLLGNRCPRESRHNPPPLRLSYRHQLQVFLRPSPSDPLDLVRQSLTAAGFELERRDVQWQATNFHVPEIALEAFGWRLRLEGLPVGQVSVPQRLHDRSVVDAVEIGYELERLVMLQHGNPEIDELPWDDHCSYGEATDAVRRSLDVYFSDRALGVRSVAEEMERSYDSAEESLERGLHLPAYHRFLRCCELLEILRARQGLGLLREHTWMERLSHLSYRCLGSGDDG